MRLWQVAAYFPRQDTGRAHAAHHLAFQNMHCCRRRRPQEAQSQARGGD